MKSKIYSVTEFGSIYSAEDINIYPDNSLNEIVMEKYDFNALCRYIEINLTDESVEDKIFKITYKRHKRVIKARNQVGVVQFANGLQIEILPKIVSFEKSDNLKELHCIFLRLLSHIKDYPYIISGDAQLGARKDYPILEVFINSYINELNRICLSGIKRDYEKNNRNLKVLKGKLLVTHNIKKNYCANNKFFCQYNEYSINNSVNRIIKSTLVMLLSVSKSHKNRDQLYHLIELFDGIDESKNIHNDLGKANYTDRTYNNFKKLLIWSKLFLTNCSFTSSQGNIINTSIMFPMEKVFEDYIAYMFKQYSKEYNVTAQDSSICLVTHKNKGKFRLRPDIVVLEKDTPVLIIDTKWKLINSHDNRKNYGISQSDMYQLYAYGKKYQATHNKTPHLVLLYPENENFHKQLDNFEYDGDLKLYVIPYSFNKNKDREIEQINDILGIINLKE